MLLFENIVMVKKNISNIKIKNIFFAKTMLFFENIVMVNISNIKIKNICC
jgi:hypothetical protein